MRAVVAMLSALAGPLLLASQACAQEVPARRLGASCDVPMASDRANATDPRTGRAFFLDYPCDLKPGEKVLFIFSLHGAGSSAAWQRRYFPAAGLKQRYRLVVATPLAAGSGAMLPGASPVRLWTPEADDQHLRDIVELVYDAFGPDNIRGFWLAGHSQGGRTANRLVCAPGFRGRVTGWLSLSGGRVGPVHIDPGLLPAPPAGAQASRLPRFAPRATIGAAATPACDLSYIFETGRNEIQRLPDRSPLADRYGCGARVRREEVTDEEPGLVFDSGQRGPVRPAWGGKARPGTAEVLVYPGCRDGRLVADVVRLDKGHTEGLEPKITETLVRLMAEAPGR